MNLHYGHLMVVVVVIFFLFLAIAPSVLEFEQVMFTSVMLLGLIYIIPHLDEAKKIDRENKKRMVKE